MISKTSLILGALALATFGLFAILPYNSILVETVYFSGVFKVLRWCWDHSLAHSPVPLIYPLCGLIIFILILKIREKAIYGVISRNFLWSAFNGLIQFGSVVIILFYWLWGFNYKRPDPLHSLPNQEDSLTVDGLYDELSRVTDTLSILRSRLPDDLAVFTYDRNAENALRADLQKALRLAGIGHFGDVRIRLLYPRGSLLHFSTAGVYLPFIGEGHIDPGLHGISWPFTIIHEMCHAYGTTGEDSCNFWALLACVNSTDPIHRYSGYFMYWRYLRSDAWSQDKERYRAFWEDVPDRLKADMTDVLAYSDRYPDIVPRLRDLIYDQYLKSHGIGDGLKSYSRIIVLADAWQRTYGSMRLADINQVD